MIEYQLWSGATITYSGTVAGHEERMFQYSRFMIDMMVRSRPGVRDPQGLSNAMRYVNPGTWGPSIGQYEMVVDRYLRIFHFLYRS